MIRFKLKTFNNFFLNYRLKNVFLFSKYIFFFHKGSNSFNKDLLSNSFKYNCNLFYLKSKYLQKMFTLNFFMNDVIVVSSNDFFKSLTFSCSLQNMNYNYMYFSYSKFLVNYYQKLSDLFLWFDYYNYNFSFFIFLIKIFLIFTYNLIFRLFYNIFLWLKLLESLC